MMLDERTDTLHMAGEPEPAKTVISRPALRKAQKPSFLKEALMLILLTLLFTGGFWLILSYLRLH